MVADHLPKDVARNYEGIAQEYLGTFAAHMNLGEPFPGCVPGLRSVVWSFVEVRFPEWFQHPWIITPKDPIMIEGSLEFRSQEKPRSEKIREEKEWEEWKVAIHCVFPWFVALEGRKVGSLKRRVRSQLARWEMKNGRLLWREAHFEVKTYKTLQLRSTFRSWAVEKVHAVVVRSTFPSQNVQSTPRSEHFWKLRCRKSARCCGAKHISESKVSKTDGFGTLLEVEMSKECTLLWREAHFQVKMYKNTPRSEHFWKLRCRKSARRCGAKHISKSILYHMYGPLLEAQMSKKCTPLWREVYFQVNMYGPFLTVEMWFCVAGARDCEPCQKWVKREGSVL